MASSEGVRPSGTDGSDHWHRESVAWQYRVSSVNKTRIRWSMFLQVVMFIAMFVRLLPAITAMMGVTGLKSLRKWNVPQPRSWEFAWLISISAVIMAWKALPKNNRLLLKQYMIGTVVFGLIPIIFGFIDQIDDFLAYMQELKNSGKVKLFGYPAVAVWFTFLVLAFQVQGFGLYFSVQLLKSWKPRNDKYKNQ